MNPLFDPIPRRSKQCLNCGTLIEGEYASFLDEDGERYTRLDYCSACKETVSDQLSLASWHAFVPKNQKIIKHPLETSLLAKLVDCLELKRWAKAFGLCQILCRLKILKYRGESSNEGIVTVSFVHRRTGEMYHFFKDIPTDPELTKLQNEIRNEISAL